MRQHSLCLVIVLALVAATLAAFSPVLRAGFVYDDRPYLLENSHISGGLTVENIRWGWTTFHAANWYPLTLVSHMLDASVFGPRPAGHHFTNLVLHTLNTVLLFHVLAGMTGAVGRSGLVAALFALHPLHVESVAWISGRKDLLSTCFFLLALAAYRRYAARPARGRYFTAALLFALGLLSKPMLVTFPFVLLLLDWWPLRRIGPRIRWSAVSRLAVEKLPLLALSLIAGLITIVAQRSEGALATWEALPLTARLGNAAISGLTYLGKTIWPTSLAIFYPYPRAGYPLPLLVAALLSIAGLTYVAIRLAGGRPWFILGWFWFAGTLLPVAGLVQVGSQAQADRYTYIPLIGIFIAVIWSLAKLRPWGAFPGRAAWSAAGAVLVVLAALSWRQTGYWRDQKTVFEHALAVTTGNYVAHFNLARLADREGRADAAIAHYREALRSYPLFFDANLQLGRVLLRRGLAEAAAAAYRQALRSRPQSVEAWFNLGAAQARLGQNAAAIVSYQKALALKPDLVEGYMNIGNILSEERKEEEALSWYARALRWGPEHAPAHYNLAVTLESLGRRESAAREYRETLRIQPGYPPAQLGLARVGAPGR